MKQYKQHTVLKRVKSNFKFFLYTVVQMYSSTIQSSPKQNIHQKKDEEMQWEENDFHSLYTQPTKTKEQQ